MEHISCRIYRRRRVYGEGGIPPSASSSSLYGIKGKLISLQLFIKWNKLNSPRIVSPGKPLRHKNLYHPPSRKYGIFRKKRKDLMERTSAQRWRTSLKWRQNVKGKHFSLFLNAIHFPVNGYCCHFNFVNLKTTQGNLVHHFPIYFRSLFIGLRHFSWYIQSVSSETLWNSQKWVILFFRFLPWTYYQALIIREIHRYYFRIISHAMVGFLK